MKMQSGCANFNQNRLRVKISRQSTQGKLLLRASFHAAKNRNYRIFMGLGCSLHKSFQESYPHQPTLIRHPETDIKLLFLLYLKKYTQSLSAAYPTIYPQILVVFFVQDATRLSTQAHWPETAAGKTPECPHQELQVQEFPQVHSPP